MNKFSIGDIIIFISEKGNHVIVADYLYNQDLYQLIPIIGFNSDIPYYLERLYVEDKYKLVSKA